MLHWIIPVFGGCASLLVIIACPYLLRQEGRIIKPALVTQEKLYKYPSNIYSASILTQNIGVFYNRVDHYFLYLLTLILNNVL